MVVGSIGYNVTQLGESKHSTYFRQIAVMYQYGELTIN
jgi:hypothetical protein